MSQGKIYTEECRDADNPSYMSSCLILLLAYILLTLGITSETWYSLNIDVDNCAQCGPLVVAIGETFERATVVNFTVEEYVRMYFGIWNVTVCTTERVCVNMTLSDADKQFGSLEIFSPAIASLHISSGWMVPAYIGVVLSLALTVALKRGTRLAMWLSAISGILTVFCVFITGWAYLIIDFETFHIKPCLPVAVIETCAAAYLQLYCAYCIWKTKNIDTIEFGLHSRAWQYWKYRRKNLPI